MEPELRAGGRGFPRRRRSQRAQAAQMAMTRKILPEATTTML
jgi:hypothetical protein